MKPVSKTIRLDESLARVIAERARRELVDESTAARQLLRKGAIEYAVELNHAGLITYREAAKFCGLEVRDFLEELFKRGPPPDRPEAEIREGLQRAIELGRRYRARSRDEKETGDQKLFLAADRGRKKR
ncbi:MAG TPA: hypothetical protein VI893_03935 [Thermoplasmata archaeon]|nr:hypothetical protein [Thermoplasmata archaeon]